MRIKNIYFTIYETYRIDIYRKIAKIKILAKDGVNWHFREI